MSPFKSMADEFLKMAAAVTDEQAAEALDKLRALEENKLTGGELARGALTGAVVGPTALAANQLISGSQPLVEALKGPRGPGLKGLAGAVGKGLAKTLRGSGGAAAGSALFGAGIPTVRRQLDRQAEMEKLRNYISNNPEPSLRSSVKQTLGVG